MKDSNYAEAGDYNVRCDFCYKKTKASKCRKNEDGWLLCPACWEVGHIAWERAVRSPAENTTPPWVRPREADLFYPKGCNIVTKSSIVGVGIVGCMIVGGAVPSGTFGGGTGVVTKA